MFRVDSQIKATEINYDSIPLTLSDYQYLVRLAHDDASPLNAIPERHVEDVWIDGQDISIDFDCGAMTMTFSGNVGVYKASDGQELEPFNYYNGENTMVLLSLVFDGISFTGDLLSANGKLISIDAVGFNSEVIDCRVLHAEKPNLFITPQPYPYVQFEIALKEAADWTLDIVDYGNTKIDTVATFSGFAQDGYNSFQWNANGGDEGRYEGILRVEDLGEDRQEFNLRWDNEDK